LAEVLFDIIQDNRIASNMKQKALDTLLKEIGVQLSKLRVKKGYSTIKEFAKKYKLPAIQYWRIEKGKANVTIKSLGRILAIHKVSFDRFFCTF
jgi:transcriptional regulator with XRE-family HTH domain